MASLTAPQTYEQKIKTERLSEAIEKYRVWYDGLSKEEQIALHLQSRNSWVKGELGLLYPEKTEEEIDAIMKAAVHL